MNCIVIRRFTFHKVFSHNILFILGKICGNICINTGDEIRKDMILVEVLLKTAVCLHLKTHKSKIMSCLARIKQLVCCYSIVRL